MRSRTDAEVVVRMACSPEEFTAVAELLEESSPRTTTFTVGLRSSPYLADHAAQGMPVLPGSFYVTKALELSRDFIGDGGASIRDVLFLRPIVLDYAEVELHASAERRSRDEHTLTFAGSDGTNVARMVVERLARPAQASPRDLAFIEDFLSRADEIVEAPQLYDALRDNANEYGSAFRRISKVWRLGDECVGRIDSRVALAPAARMSCVLDSMMQLLAPFAVARRKTVMLESVDAISIMPVALPDRLWGHATLRPDASSATRIVGDVHVYDDVGRTVAAFTRITFALIDSVASSHDAAPVTFAVAANFTAEPSEDALNFWAAHFRLPARVTFAPYNQLFQQLLDPQSALRMNRDGVNVILLSLEEWLGGNVSRHTTDAATIDRALGSHARYTLPNGMVVAHVNQYETDYLYKEIFVDRAYMRHGIELHDGATVVDIGANIGMFSLFAMQECAQPRIYAFEPSPKVCTVLRANAEAYGGGVTVVNAGVASAPGSGTFTFYEQSSVFSGFHPDAVEDGAAIQAAVHNALTQAAALDEQTAAEFAPEMMTDRLRASTHDCVLTTVSQIIRTYDIDTIDLLKIDAEKSERDIINGIAEADWPRIKQIVVEIHDRSGRAVDEISALLEGKGFECVLEYERALKHTGLVNLYATRRERAGGRNSDMVPRSAVNSVTATAGDTVAEFSAALKSFAGQSHAPVVLCLCPASPAANADPGIGRRVQSAESSLVADVRSVPGIHVITTEDLQQKYPVADYYDEHAYESGRVPYTVAQFTAIGTAVFRSALSAKRSPLKLIVLDCDHTLWKGVCGEVGPHGIEIGDAYVTLQRALLRQVNAGVLLAVCSKNSERDVFSVFDERDDMHLKREHIAAWRVNWEPKSANIRAIANELNIGLDAVLVLDDSPIECAEIRSACPEVACIQMPDGADAVGRFVNHAWFLDALAATDEDRGRTQLYQENARREAYRAQSPSLAGFIDGLNLRVAIQPATEADVDRIAQLTIRTNQFNFSTIRRSSADVRELLQRPGTVVLAVRVADRFGDYGLVGAVTYALHDDRCVVDTFLLSCRVLGRGVEHAVLAEIGRRAKGSPRWVDLRYNQTDRNAPVREFLRSLNHAVRADTKVVSFSADEAAAVVYNPAQEPPSAVAEREGQHAHLPSGPLSPANLAEPWRLVAEELNDVDRILGAIDAQRRAGGETETAAPSSNDPLEAQILKIWKRVLGRDRIGLRDHYLEVGGTSLKGVQIIAAIRRETGHNVSVVTLFECPTVALLAERLRGRVDEPGQIPSAIERGQRRKRVFHPRSS